ncbi:MAG: dienelactone hydrolase family protein [Phaeodactylibacter sp.]|nr:dienelactone hydrolase family protein [Phaeodactylibacter sp.]
MEEHHLQVQRTARYYTLGTLTENTTHLWIACHGYGQLASRLIRKFEGVDLQRHFIVAPEGLSRFYWQGVTGQVAASWMTKADRLHEIEDYSNYLQELLELFCHQRPDLKVVLFGFSQGCATIMRWMMAKFPKVDRAVLWAGLFPEDISYRPHYRYLEQTKFHFIYGTEDEYLTPERQAMHEALMQQEGLEVAVQSFEGKHHIDRAVLESLVRAISASDPREAPDLS